MPIYIRRTNPLKNSRFMLFSQFMTLRLYGNQVLLIVADKDLCKSLTYWLVTH